MTATKIKAKKPIQLKTFDEEKLNEEAIEIINRRGLNEYKKGYVGLYAYSDATAGAGGGTGSFLWFPSYEKLYQFLADYLVVLSPGPVSVDHELVFHKVGKIVEELDSGTKTQAEAVQQINRVAKGFSQIEWIGDLESLCSGSEKFPKNVRAQFFGEGHQRAGGRSLKTSEYHRFIGFLGEYGC